MPDNHRMSKTSYIHENSNESSKKIIIQDSNKNSTTNLKREAG